MLRVSEARDWSAEELDAAAAALGNFAASVLRMGPMSYEANYPELKAMRASSDQVARWAAVDAASYGRAALAAYDRKAAALEASDRS